MGIFSSKQRPGEQSVGVKRLPSLPEFPEFPEIPEDDEAPAYESTIKDIKKGVDGAEPKSVKHIMAAEDYSTGEDKPLFVKIDQYKAALASLPRIDL